STTSSRRMPSPEETSSAAARSKPPENTDRRAKTAFSASVKRSWDQSMAACSVRWRGRAVLAEPERIRNEPSGRAPSPDRGRHRAGEGGLAGAREDPDRAVGAVGDLEERRVRQPGRRRLQPNREPVVAAAYPRHGGDLFGAGEKSGRTARALSMNSRVDSAA